MIMPFGKHKGHEIRDIPRNYLTWLLTLQHIDAQLRDEIVALHEYEEPDFALGRPRWDVPAANQRRTFAEMGMSFDSQTGRYESRSHPYATGDPF